PKILRLSNTDKAVWAATFFLTVVADLTVAVEVGIIMAALLYTYRVAQTTTVSTVTPDYIETNRVHILQGKDIPPYVSIIRVHGPFLYGTTDKLADETADLDQLGEIVILRLRNMTALDATGVHEFRVLAERLKQTGRKCLICGLRDQPGVLLRQSDIVQLI